MKPSLFIASSGERSDVADAVAENLHDVVDTTIWRFDFTPGRVIFSELLESSRRHDFAVVVVTPDDVTNSRGGEHKTPRDNVIFELGLFLGALGGDRVFAVMDEEAKPKMPSDYLGVQVPRYRSARADQDLTQALHPACVKIRREIQRLGPLPRPTPPGFDYIDPSAVGLKKIFKSYDDAEHEILRDLRTSSGPVRLFFHIASQNIGISGSLFDILSEIADRNQPEVRILHSATDSPLFAPDRLLSIGKDPDRVTKSLRYVRDSLQELQKEKTSSLRTRNHSLPFVWRIYGFSERLYVMPYFSKKDATKKSPVLLFEKGEDSMYQSFVDWYDYVWASNAPKEMSLDLLITPATPSGAALIGMWDGFHVFGIPKRDVVPNSDFVRFYGVGGKKKSQGESFEECALREGAEETGMSVSELVDAHDTEYFRSDGAIVPIHINSSEKRPKLIYEKRDHSGHGSMHEKDDVYYMVGYEARFSREPRPSRELAAILFLEDRHLALFRKRQDISLGELLTMGARLTEQEGVNINREKIMVPHGTASYVIRRANI